MRCGRVRSPGKQFKQHFCESCVAEGFQLPADRVFAARVDVADLHFPNQKDRGFWSAGTFVGACSTFERCGYRSFAQPGSGQLKIVVFKEPPPEAWVRLCQPLPHEWYTSDARDAVALRVGWQTLTPVVRGATETSEVVPGASDAPGSDIAGKRKLVWNQMEVGMEEAAGVNLPGAKANRSEPPVPMAKAFPVAAVPMPLAIPMTKAVPVAADPSRPMLPVVTCGATQELSDRFPNAPYLIGHVTCNGILAQMPQGRPEREQEGGREGSGPIEQDDLEQALLYLDLPGASGYFHGQRVGGEGPAFSFIDIASLVDPDLTLSRGSGGGSGSQVSEQQLSETLFETDLDETQLLPAPWHFLSH